MKIVGAIPERAFNIAEPVYDCDLCRDCGWVVADGYAARCECRDPAKNPRLVTRALQEAGLEQEELASAFKRWDTSAQPEPIFAWKWLAGGMAGQQQKQRRDPWSFLIYGLNGRGKTMTAAQMMRRYIEAGGQDPLWVSASEAFDQVQEERYNGKCFQGGALEKHIWQCGLLVLDELGRATRKDAETAENTIHEWLARRFRRHGLTVMTSNMAKLSDLGAPHLESRLGKGLTREMVSAEDYRDRKLT